MYFHIKTHKNKLNKFFFPTNNEPMTDRSHKNLKIQINFNVILYIFKFYEWDIKELHM